MLRNHTDLINHLASLINAKTYLEIGVFNTTHNFEHIQIEEKIGVDPAVDAEQVVKLTSDQYFKAVNDDFKFDIIFIDGLHHADQVKKDFENALRHLSDHGFIVMHDCNPHSELITHVPRDRGEWTGDVYKFACTLSEYRDIDFHTVDFDYGCAVVWRRPGAKPGRKIGKITWAKFQAHKKRLLNLIEPELFLVKFPPKEIEV